MNGDYFEKAEQVRENLPVAEILQAMLEGAAKCAGFGQAGFSGPEYMDYPSVDAALTLCGSMSPTWMSATCGVILEIDRLDLNQYFLFSVTEWEKYLETCVCCVYIRQTNEMRRFNFFIEQNWIDRLNREREKHGCSSVAQFIRYIIIKFFQK